MQNSKIDVEGHLRTIFRRCVICPPGSPSCPPCSSDENCSLLAQSCSACASTICVKIGSLPGQGDPPKQTPVGAIAGGVVGGFAVLVAVTYLVYRSCIRNRRTQTQAWVEQKAEKRDQSTLHRADRQSTRSASSIASTVLTRASNIIQIAYIPGVTNRTPPESPRLLVPPVPPLPFGGSNTSAPSSPRIEQDMHFFMPGDLRDSTYSDMTQDQRISLTPSLARASVATTIYRNNAVVSPVPAQQAFMAKPAVVSVRSGSTTPGSSGNPQSYPPPVPPVPISIAQSNSSIVGRNLTARPIEVRKTSSGTRVPTLGNLVRASSAGKTSNSSSTKTDNAPISYWEEKEVVLSPSTTIDDSPTVSPIVRPRASLASFHSAASAISPIQGAGSPLREVTSARAADDGLNAMIEDAMNRAARDLTHRGLGSRPDLRKQDSGPFSDSNEVKENMY